MSKNTQGVEQSALSRFIRHADADEKARVYGKVIDRATEMQRESLVEHFRAALREPVPYEGLKPLRERR